MEGFEPIPDVSTANEPFGRAIAGRLLEYARHIKRYARTYPEAFARATDDEGRRRYAFFVGAARRLGATLERLYAMANETPGLAYLNREQFEAEVAEAREALARLDLRAPTLN